MKPAILILAVAMAATAGANELDKDMASPEKQAASVLPQTTVIRVNNKTKQVEVLHLQTRLAAGKKLENAKFEKVAVNTEIPGIKFDASNEMDATSSTSAWRYGYAVGPRGGVVAGGVGFGRGGYGGYYGGYGMGMGYGGYGANYGYNYGNNCGYGYGCGCGGNNQYYCNNSFYTVNTGCYNQGYACGGDGYYASYRVASYNWVAQPYYTYATPDWSYYYCGW